MGREWWLAALVFGDVAGEACATRWTAGAGWSAAGAMAVAAWGLAVRHRGGRLLAVFAIGMSIGIWRLGPVLSPAPVSGDVSAWALPCDAVVEGVVVGDPVVRGDATVIVVAAQRAVRGRERMAASGRIRLTVRTPLQASPGAIVRAATRLRRPKNFRTPGAFDWVGHLASRGVYVVGSARGVVDVLSSAPAGPTRWLSAWRRQIATAIDATGSTSATPILRALVIGDDAGIPPAVRDEFARAGVAHVLSVSGLHLALVVAGASWLTRWVWSRSAWLLVRSNVDVVSASVGALAAVTYGVLAGLATPTARSALMVVLGLGATLIGRRPEPMRALGLTALVIMWCRPGASREAGFQLSFVSVLALLSMARPPAESRPRLALVREALRASVVASVATTPLTAFHFHQVSLIAPLANLVVIPLFGSVVLAPALAGACCVGFVPVAAHALFSVATLVLQVAVALVEWLAGWPWAAVETPIPSAWELIAMYGLLVGPRLPSRELGLGVVGVAALFLVADAGMAARARGLSGSLRITFLDVGQGDAAVVQWPDGRVMLVDAGGFPGSDFDVGSAVVAPFLASARIRGIDLAIVTHPHPDHFAGMPAVFARHPVGLFWWDGLPASGDVWARLDAVARARDVRRERPLPQWNVPGWPGLSVLHPPGEWSSSPNDASVVVALRWRVFGALFTGDAERAAEAAMAAEGRLQPTTVLKVPHHGSRTSSTAGFLDRVRPRIAVISAGTDNRYGLPAPDVEARYRARGVCVLRTDRCGAVTVVTDGLRVQTTAVVPECQCPPLDLTLPP